MSFSELNPKGFFSRKVLQKTKINSLSQNFLSFLMSDFLR